MLRSVPWPIEDPEAYFARRGFSLLVVNDAVHGDYSADILSEDRSRCVADRYSSGSSEEQAAISAVRRWHVEQDSPPPLPLRLP
jgi:hypothetical protein